MNPDDPAFGRESDPHVTLLYKICNGDPKPFVKLLAHEKPIQVVLGKVSLFKTNDAFDVVKIGVESADLHRLNQKMVDLASRQYRDFEPHVTVAFVNKGAGAKFVGDDTFAGAAFTSDELCFSEKDGKKIKLKVGA